MKKTKLFAVIAVILGGVSISAGILINAFAGKEENKSGANHEPTKIEKCKTLSLEEKNTFIISKYALSEIDKEYDYKLLKNEEDYSNITYSYEQNNEELELDFSNYDYLVYFIYEEQICEKTNYLTDYNLSGNKLNIEFTKYEFNKTECSENTIFGYGIAIEKDKYIEGQTKIEITNKEDPFKECYE